MPSADFQNNDVIEYTGRKEKKENIEKYLIFIDPEAKKRKKSKSDGDLIFYFLEFSLFYFKAL